MQSNSYALTAHVVPLQLPEPEADVLGALEAQLDAAQQERAAAMRRWQNVQQRKAAAVKLFKEQNIKSGPFVGAHELC
jgi:hypothetical protein